MFWFFVLTFASSFMTIKEKVDALNKAYVDKRYIEHLFKLSNDDYFECSRRANNIADEIKKVENIIASLGPEISSKKVQLRYMTKDNSIVIDYVSEIKSKEVSLKRIQDKRMFLTEQFDCVNSRKIRLVQKMDELNQKKKTHETEMDRIKNAPIREAV